MLTGQLAANREQLELLERARREPWLLAIVDRVKKVFGVQRDDRWLWEENGRRWPSRCCSSPETYIYWSMIIVMTRRLACPPGPARTQAQPQPARVRGGYPRAAVSV